MKLLIKVITSFAAGIALVVFCTGCAVLIWFAWWTATAELPDDIGFGYYRDFDIARKSIQQSGCAESIKYGRHEDLTLEDFHFRVRTKSGRLVLLFFHDNMDVDQVCKSPKGILVFNPWRLAGEQGYSIEYLSQQWKEKGFVVRDIKDMLCNMDEIVPFFEANYYDETIPVIKYEDDEFRHYLQIRILGEGEKEFYGYPE